MNRSERASRFLVEEVNRPKSAPRVAHRLVVLAVVIAALLTPAAASAQLSVLAATSNATSLAGALSVGVSGNDAYATAYWPGQLTAVNVPNLISAAPTIDGSTLPTASMQNGTNVTFAGHYAFVVSKNRNGSATSNDDGVTGNSLTIVDITNPASPTVVGSVRDPARLFGGYGVSVSGNYAYVAYQGTLPGQPTTPDVSSGGFSVIDITNPAGPTIVANIDNGSLPAPYTGSNALYHATSVAISGNYAYVTAFYNSAITVIDISNPLAPQIVASLRDATHFVFPEDLAIQGNYLYVANQVNASSPQLTVVSIATPTSPAVIGSLSSQFLNGAYRIRVRGDFAYLAGSSASSIGVVDISNPVAPRLADYVQDPGHLTAATGLDLDGSSHYVIAASPRAMGQSASTYPPYTNTTGTISAIGLIPNPIAVTIAASSEPPSQTGLRTANFSFSVNDTVSAVQCRLDSGGFVPCTSATTASYTALATGSHTFTVQATDAAGNTTTAGYTWQINSGAPAPVAPGPAISDTTHPGGAPLVGDSLSVTGTWTGNAPITYTYQWLQCTPTCAPIPGATQPTYTVAGTDLGTTIAVTVTASNGQGTTPVTTAPTAMVSTVPQNTALPTLSTSGVAAVGNQITVSNGSWSPTPTGYSYQWLRCSSACSPIAGATNRTYTPVAADANQAIEAQVVASNAYGPSSPAVTAPTSAVVGPPVNQAPPTITGAAVQGQSVKVSNGTWSPTPSSYAFQWERCAHGSCTPVAGATNASFSVTNADVGYALKAVVSAYDASPIPGTITVGPTGVVAPGPANTSAPVISGAGSVGSTLSTSQGTWTGTPSSFSYQWTLCHKSCLNISGANQHTYTVQAGDLGGFLQVVVTASSPQGSASMPSNTVGPVYPSMQTINAVLDRWLIPHGNSASLRSVRRHGFRFTINAPSAGTLVLSWYYLPKGASLTKHKHGAPRPVLIAVGTVTFSGPSQRKTVTIKLTKAGKQRLATVGKLALTSQGAFKPAGGPWFYQRRRFVLR